MQLFDFFVESEVRSLTCDHRLLTIPFHVLSCPEKGTDPRERDEDPVEEKGSQERKNRDKEVPGGEYGGVNVHVVHMRDTCEGRGMSA